MSDPNAASYAAVDQTAVPAEGPKMGFGARLTNILFSPSEVFADINRAPKPVLPVIVLCLVGLFSFMFVQWKMHPDWRTMTEDQISKELAAQGKTMKDLTPQERVGVDARIKYTVMFAPYFGVVAVIFLPISVAVVALLFWLGALMLQSQATYPKIFSVVAWSFLGTSLVGLVLTIIGSFVRSADSINFMAGEGVITTNPAPLVSSADHPVLHTLLSRFDVITIWILILCSMGLAAVSRKKKTADMAIVPFGWWGLFVLVTVALAAIRGVG